MLLYSHIGSLVIGLINQPSGMSNEHHKIDKFIAVYPSNSQPIVNQSLICKNCAYDHCPARPQICFGNWYHWSPFGYCPNVSLGSSWVFRQRNLTTNYCHRVGQLYDNSGNWLSPASSNVAGWKIRSINGGSTETSSINGGFYMILHCYVQSSVETVCFYMYLSICLSICLSIYRSMFI